MQLSLSPLWSERLSRKKKARSRWRKEGKKDKATPAAVTQILVIVIWSSAALLPVFLFIFIPFYCFPLTLHQICVHSLTIYLLNQSFSSWNAWLKMGRLINSCLWSELPISLYVYVSFSSVAFPQHLLSNLYSLVWLIMMILLLTERVYQCCQMFFYLG